MMVTCTDTSWTTQLPPHQGLGGLRPAHMPSSEILIAEARERFRLLRRIHSLNCVSFPELPSVITDDVLDAELADDITLLRSDIKSLPIRLQQVDIDQVTSDPDLCRLIEAFSSLLAMFESAVVVKTAAVKADIQTHQVGTRAFLLLWKPLSSPEGCRLGVVVWTCRTNMMERGKRG